MLSLVWVAFCWFWITAACVVSVIRVWWLKRCASCWESRTTNRMKCSLQGTTQVLQPKCGTKYALRPSSSDHAVCLSPDFLLWMDCSGRVLPLRPGVGGAVTAPPSCVAATSKPSDGSVAALASDFQKFSPFTVLEDGTVQPCQEAVGVTMEPRSFLTHHHIRSPAPAASVRTGTNGGPLDYGTYYVPGSEFYPGLPKEHSLESQDSSTLSSPPSDSVAQPVAKGPAGAPDSLFQFSIGKILEDEGGSGGQAADCQIPGFYEGVSFTEVSGADREPSSPSQPRPSSRPDAESSCADHRQIKRCVQLLSHCLSTKPTACCSVSCNMCVSAGSSCPSMISGTTATTVRFWWVPGP